LPDEIQSVHYYGTGCGNEQNRQLINKVFQDRFPKAEIHVTHDLMAVCHAVLGNEKGIACILGTGSNSCVYDGMDIVEKAVSLGYLLGDEGSGSVLGRLFMNAIFKNPDFSSIRDQYLAQTKLTQADIINKVYREPMGNRFLATTSLYIMEHLDNPLLCDLVIQNFRQFFRFNIKPYNRPDLPVHFVGSMAHYYEQQLNEAAQAEGFHVGLIMQSPMEGLLTYHAQ
jgi:N-acetylglucosamine kinase-like BadF-type ATPase